VTPSDNRTYPASGFVFRKLLDTLESIRSCAERAPYPPADLVKMHGERAHMVSSFAMLRMMAEHAIETIENLTPYKADGSKS
jgi:hypothetical protein